MKNNPLIRVLWAMLPLFFLSTQGWSTNETINTLLDENSECTMTISATPVGIFCGEITGAIDVNITGGKAPYKIEWDNSNSTIWAEITTNNNSYRIPNLPGGSYLVKVMDADGCRQMVTNVTLDVNASNLTYTIEPGDPCSTNGSMTIRVAGANAPFWVILEGPTSGAVIANDNAFRIDNLLPGDYKVIVDKDGCGHTQYVTIKTSPSPLSLSITPQGGGDACTGGGGDIMLNISGGNPEYLISWYGASNGNSRSHGNKLVQNLPSGSYTFTIRDINGCTASASVDITNQGGSDLACVLTQTPVICDNMGQIGVAINGGKPSYRVDYSGPVSGSVIATNVSAKSGTASILDLPSGTYQINVIDSRGCVASESITVGGAPTDLACIVTQTPVLCDNLGQIGVAINGGQPSYRVDYSGPVSGSVIATNTAAQAGNATILDLPAGYYTVVVTDSRGCSATESISVGGGPSDLKCVVTQTPVICDNMGQIGVAINGGQPSYRVDYSGPVSGAVIATNTAAQAGNATILDLPAGYYTVVVTDSRGCSATESITVGGAPSDLKCIVNQTPGVCDDRGTISIGINGGQPTYRVDYSGPATGAVIATTTAAQAGTATISGVPPGYYIIVVTDSRGCSETETITVGSGASDLACVVTQTPVICDNMGQIGVAISGGQPTYRVDYSGPVSGAVIATTTAAQAATATILSLPAGYYTVVVTDSRGCSATESITVGGAPSDLKCIVNQTPGVCDDRGTISIGINGGQPTYRVDYSGPATGAVIATTTAAQAGTATISGVPPGYYTIVVTDSRGCSETETITVGNGASDLACVVTQTPVICDNMGQIGVAISGGQPTYRVDYSGPVSGAVIATTTAAQAATASILHLPAGTYTIVVTDSRGCTASESITVGGSPTDLACIVTQTPVICDNMGQIGVAISGGQPTYRVDYSGPRSGSIIATTTAAQAATASILDLPAGKYTITVIDSRGCTASESINVGGSVSDLACIVTQTPQVCNNMGQIGVAISGGQPTYRVDYSGPVTGAVIATTTAAQAATATLPDLPSGNYTIVVTDSRGCTATESISVGGAPSDLTCHVSVNPKICTSGPGLVVDISGGTPTYRIDYSGPVSGSTTSSGGSTTIPLPLGTYKVVVTDANGCSASETAVITEGVNDLHCQLIATDAICTKNGYIEVLISGGKPGFTVSWTAGHATGTGTTMGYSYVFEAPCPGVYEITVTDANGCTVMEPTTVRQAENNLAYQLFANPGIQEGNGWIEIYFQAGRAPYSIDLTGPRNYQTISIGPIVLSSLSSGNYSVNITDANGCQKQQYITVPSLDTPDPTPMPDGMRIAGDNDESPISPSPFFGNRQESEEFEVYQNYPNPFTTSTTIGFNLPRTMEVMIIVQDHFGKTISVSQQEYGKGYNEYQLNKSDMHNGFFYYTIKAEEFTKTVRMLNVH